MFSSVSLLLRNAKKSARQGLGSDASNYLQEDLTKLNNTVIILTN